MIPSDLRKRLHLKIEILLRRAYGIGYELLFGRWFFAAYGRKNFVHPLASIRNHGAIHMGDQVVINRVVCLWRNTKLMIGNRVEINPGVCIYGDVTIGNNVMIAPNCTISAGRYELPLGTPMNQQVPIPGHVVICDDVWVGANCSIVDGVTVAQGCVIGAGSVVTESTVPCGIYGGVPAKLLKMRM